MEGYISNFYGWNQKERELKNENSKLRDENSKLRDENSRTMQSMLEEESAKKRALNEKEDFSEKLYKAESANKGLETANRMLKTNVEHYKTRIVVLEGRQRDFENQHTQLNAELASLKSSKTLNESNIKQLETELREVNCELQRFKDEKTTILSELSGKKREVKYQQEREETLTEKVSQLEKVKDQLDRDVSHYKAQISKLEGETKHLRRSCENSASDIEKHTNKICELKETITGLKAENDILEEDRNRFRKRFVEREDVLRANAERVNQLDDEIQTLKENFDLRHRTTQNQHEQEVQRLKEAHELALKLLVKAHEGERKRLQEAKEQHLADICASKDSEIQTLVLVNESLYSKFQLVLQWAKGNCLLPVEYSRKQITENW
jgi:chromosome segregation ATPase